MTALTYPKVYSKLADNKKRVFPIATGVVVWEGGLGAIVAGSGAGAAVAPASVAANLKIVGVAAGTYDNRIAPSTPLTGEFERGVFLLNNDATDPVDISWIGQPVYASDDNTVSKTSASGTKSQAGTLFALDPSGAVWVEIV